MATSNGRAVALAIASVLTIVSPRAAAAATVVTLCESDDQQGPGVNLTAALGVDASGALLPAVPEEVRFDCGGAATIRITHRHDLRQNFDVDGGGLITLDAQGRAGMFRLLDPATHFRLSGLTLRGAGVDATRSDFGFVRAETSVDPFGAVTPTIELFDCTVDNNAFGIEALHGAVYTRRTHFLSNRTFALIAATAVTIEQSTFVGNRAFPVFSWGGTVKVEGSLFSMGWQMLLGACQLQVVNSQFLDNANSAIWLSLCDATIDRSTFDGNRGGDGGAIRMLMGSRLTVTGSTFSRNSASRNGGAISIIRTSGGPEQILKIRRGTFTANRAGDGGAIDLGSAPILFEIPDATLEAVTVLFNQNVAAGDGGAIAGTSATTRIARGLFVDNQAAGAGGAVSVHQRPIMEAVADPQRVRIPVFRGPLATTVIANSLFARNRATSGSAFDGSNASFINSSVARNGGGAALNVPSGAAVRLLNTVLLANAGGNCGGAGAYVNDGHNLQFPADTCGASIPVVDAGLDDTFVPLPGSPAFAAGDNGKCLAAPINGLDLFGQTRPEGSVCTIGAIEGDIEQTLRRRRDDRRGSSRIR